MYGTFFQRPAAPAACEHSDVSGQFVLCNDDMFVMAPQPDGMPVLHRGPVADVEAYYVRRAAGRYLIGLSETRDLLVPPGHPEPLQYELHVPLPVAEDGMLKALETGRNVNVVHKRTLYGNLVGIGGQQMRDVKTLNRSPRFDPGRPFLSTMPDAFANGRVGAHVRRTFPAPRRYEAGGPQKIGRWVRVASIMLWGLAGRRWGPSCPVECRCSCLAPYPYFVRWGAAGPWVPYVGVDGAWRNASPCGCGAGCSCTELCEERPPGPVYDVVSVDVDGDAAPAGRGGDRLLPGRFSGPAGARRRKVLAGLSGHGRPARPAGQRRQRTRLRGRGPCRTVTRCSRHP